jgi:hypothetical protein
MLKLSKIQFFSLFMFIFYTIIVLWTSDVSKFGFYDYISAFFQNEFSSVLTDKDFGNYWIAALKTLSGDAKDLFDPEVYQGFLKLYFPNVQTARNWSYSPHYLIFIWPFGFFNYNLSYFIFQCGTFIFFMWSVWMVTRRIDFFCVVMLTAFSWANLNFWAGQNGFFTSGCFILAFSLMQKRPIFAGLCFAALTVKPQLGLLIPLILLLEGRLTVIVAAVCGTIGLVLLSIVLFGVDSWIGYLGPTTAAQTAVLTDWQGFFLFMMPTFFGAMRGLGLSPIGAFLVQVPFSIFALALTVWVARKSGIAFESRMACYGLLIFLFTPYAFNYDFGFVIVLVAIAALTPPSNSPEQRVVLYLALLLVGIAPVIGMIYAALGYPIAMLAIIRSLMMFLHKAPRDQEQRSFAWR